MVKAGWSLSDIKQLTLRQKKLVMIALEQQKIETMNVISSAIGQAFSDGKSKDAKVFAMSKASVENALIDYLDEVD